MDWDDTPSTLDAELLEECSGDDSFGTGETVRVEQCAADDAHDNDAKAASEDLGRIADYRATANSSEIGNDLGNCNSIGREIVLV